MTTNSGQGDEFLVLTDPEGSHYAIPRDVVEQYRLTAQERDQVEQALGGDVAGFSMAHAYMTEQLAMQHRADLLREADQARRAQAARAGQAGESAGAGHPQPILTGIWRRLPFVRPAGAAP